MSSNKFTVFVNYLFLFLVINYRLIVGYITHVDSAGYGLIFLSVVVLVLNARSFKTLQLTKPIVFWLIWCFYAFLNYYTHPHDVNPIGIFGLYRKIFIPLIAMTVVVKEYRDNETGLLRVALITYLMYAIGGYYFDSGILYRDLGEENDLGNAYAITVCFSLFYLAVLNRMGKLRMVWFLVLSAIVIIALAMSGTRKAFGAGCIMIVFWALSVFDLRKFRTWCFIAIFVYGGLKGYNALIENTYMGQRMEVLEQQQEMNLPPDAPQFLSVFGDRASHYYYGWELFQKHPLLGVGPGQTRVGSSYIHSEYMVQLTDNGLIGFTLFFAFYWWIGIRILRQYQRNKSITICILGGFACILFLGLTAWIWEFPYYFLPLGTCIAYCKYNSNETVEIKR